MQGFQADLEAPDTDIALIAIGQHKLLLQIAKVGKVQGIGWSALVLSVCALPEMLEGW